MKLGEPFLAEGFRDLGRPASVNKALCRLASLGEIERVTRGVYVRPIIHKVLGKVSPSYFQVLELIVKSSGETLQTHGVEAVRKFGLSTQMQVRPVFYTSGRSRRFKIGSLDVELRHVHMDWLQHSDSLAGLALVAMFYVGKVSLNKYMCSLIMSKIPRDEQRKLMGSSMPSWMRKQCELAVEDALKLTS
ncbi:TPA: hypothetical protein SL670_002166 [Pseudomonas aeruginosa]|nr:hypothetical protein [Pseudomonas aeruginosa]